MKIAAEMLLGTFWMADCGISDPAQNPMPAVD